MSERPAPEPLCAHCGDPLLMGEPDVHADLGVCVSVLRRWVRGAVELLADIDIEDQDAPRVRYFLRAYREHMESERRPK